MFREISQNATRTAALVLLASAVLLGGCPSGDRSCESESDCFEDEQCIAGPGGSRCISKDDLADDAESGTDSATEAPDGGDRDTEMDDDMPDDDAGVDASADEDGGSSDCPNDEESCTPTIEFASPSANASVCGTVPIAVDVTAPDRDVRSVEIVIATLPEDNTIQDFNIDGASESRYKAEWDAESDGNGDYAIRAEVATEDGETASASRNVTVSCDSSVDCTESDDVTCPGDVTSHAKLGDVAITNSADFVSVTIDDIATSNDGGSAFVLATIIGQISICGRKFRAYSPYTIGPERDYLLMRWDLETDTPSCEWVSEIAEDSGISPGLIDVDQADNVYVAGSCDGETKFQDESINCKTGIDVWAGRVSPEGEAEWATTLPADGRLRDVALHPTDSDNFLVAVEQFQEDEEQTYRLMHFTPADPVAEHWTAEGTGDYKLDIAGDDAVQFHDTDAGEGAILAGDFNGSELPGEFELTGTGGSAQTVTSTESLDGFMARFDLESGKIKAATRLGAKQYSEAISATTIDDEGDIWIAAPMYGDPDGDGYCGSRDALGGALLEYGRDDWSKRKSTVCLWSHDYLYLDDIAADGAGHILAAGDYNSSLQFGPSEDDHERISFDSDRDGIYVASIAGDATMRWLKTMGTATNADDIELAIASESSDEFAASLNFGGKLDVGDITYEARWTKEFRHSWNLLFTMAR